MAKTYRTKLHILFLAIDLYLPGEIFSLYAENGNACLDGHYILEKFQ